MPSRRLEAAAARREPLRLRRALTHVLDDGLRALVGRVFANAPLAFVWAEATPAKAAKIRALRSGCERRFAIERHQAGGIGTLRRHQPVSGQRQGTADQDGAGRKARRRRTAAGPQGGCRSSRACVTRRPAWD